MTTSEQIVYNNGFLLGMASKGVIKNDKSGSGELDYEPLLIYDLTNASSNIIQDLSGKGNHGTATNFTTPFYFNGSTTNIRTPILCDILFGDYAEFTMNFAFKTAASPITQHGWMSVFSCTDNGGIGVTFDKSMKQIICGFTTPSSSKYIGVNGSYNTLYVCTCIFKRYYGATELIVFVNNELQDVSFIKQDLKNNNKPFYIGADPTASGVEGLFHGMIYTCSLYQGAPSMNDVLSFYNSCVSRYQ